MGQPTILRARVVSTTNQKSDGILRNAVTFYHIHVTDGVRSWSVLRRYTEFHALQSALPGAPSLPPKLAFHNVDSLAEHLLLLDCFHRSLLATSTIPDEVHAFLRQGEGTGNSRCKYPKAPESPERCHRWSSEAEAAAHPCNTILHVGSPTGSGSTGSEGVGAGGNIAEDRRSRRRRFRQSWRPAIRATPRAASTTLAGTQRPL